MPDAARMAWDDAPQSTCWLRHRRRRSLKRLQIVIGSLVFILLLSSCSKSSAFSIFPAPSSSSLPLLHCRWSRSRSTGDMPNRHQCCYWIDATRSRLRYSQVQCRVMSDAASNDNDAEEERCQDASDKSEARRKNNNNKSSDEESTLASNCNSDNSKMNTRDSVVTKEMFLRELLGAGEESNAPTTTTSTASSASTVTPIVKREQRKSKRGDSHKRVTSSSSSSSSDLSSSSSKDMAPSSSSISSSKQRKSSSKEYKVLDNRDLLPFAVQVATPDPYTHPELKRKQAKKVKKRINSIENNFISSQLYTSSSQQQSLQTLLGEFQLDKHTTTGDMLQIGLKEYKVIQHRCLYKYAGGQKFVMVKKILHVKEITRLQTEELLLRQWNQSPDDDMDDNNSNSNSNA